MPEEPKAGRYRVDCEIGRGGMGRVYRAFDMHLGRTVALKSLPSAVREDTELRRRLAQEARAACALNHPGVATVFDFVDDAAESFIVFEYVEGATLRQELASRSFPAEEVLSIGIQLADALIAAHDRGITHRDLKPENIMIVPAPERPGRVKILDFGLAKLRRPLTPAAGARAYEGQTASAATAPGLLVGTVNYMAPEQLEGEPADGRSDVYALGLILYEMAAGWHPFVGRTPSSTIANILKQEAPPLSTHNPLAPPELDRIVRKCLRKHPEERYQSARELLVDLANLRRDLGQPPTFGAPAAEPEKASPVVWHLEIPRNRARFLLGLIQWSYLVMYAVALYKFADVLRVSREIFSTRLVGGAFLTAAGLGAPLRIYVLAALGLDYADLGKQFHRIFPAALALDFLWALTPGLFPGQLRGLVVICIAALAYLPFSQRSLVGAAYAAGGGRSSAIRRSPSS